MHFPIHFGQRAHEYPVTLNYRFVHMLKQVHFGNNFLSIMAHFDGQLTKPKLAKTALLFCRVADVPFLPKMDQ